MNKILFCLVLITPVLMNSYISRVKLNKMLYAVQEELLCNKTDELQREYAALQILNDIAEQEKNYAVLKKISLDSVSQLVKACHVLTRKEMKSFLTNLTVSNTFTLARVDQNSDNQVTSLDGKVKVMTEMAASLLAKEKCDNYGCNDLYVWLAEQIGDDQKLVEHIKDIKFHHSDVIKS